jgi:hypothetical protein
MTRNFAIEGPCLVRTKGGQHMSGRAIGDVTELGLTSDSVKIEPRFRHRDISADDFGPDVPAEVQWQLSDALIHMTLVHFDYYVLDVCLGECMGGGAINWGVTMELGPAQNPVFGPDLLLNARGGMAGTLAAAGTLMGAGLPMFASGNHYISLNLSSPYAGRPWRFRSCYLAERPVVHPIGTQYSQVELVWRAIPYAPIFVSGLVDSVYTTARLPYSLPPAVDRSVRLNLGLVDPNAEPGSDGDDPGDYYLTREVLSSGLCLWDRLAD